MHAIYIFASIILFVSAVHSTASITPSDTIGKELGEIVTKSLSISYNYLKLASRFGTNEAYPGFWSFFVKLSDGISSRSHDLVKFLALRRFSLTRLIGEEGLQIDETLKATFNLTGFLNFARGQNQALLKKIEVCHLESDSLSDANVQDYLESHLLDHHIEIDKLLYDIENRINATPEKSSDRHLIIHMIDEELLQTYGDRRKDIFS